MTTDDARLATAISETAAEVAGLLTALRQDLTPVRRLWDGTPGADLGPAEEWTIAADGLLGPDGVLGQVSRAMAVPLPDLPDAGWAGEASPGRG